MIQALIPGIIGLVGNFIDKAVPDKDKANEMKAQFALQAQQMDLEELKGAVAIITAEAKGESWLQRNWRPMTMVWFSVLVGAYWFGYTPPNLPEASVLELFALVQLGLGGYVIGRSAEKIVPQVVTAIKSK